MGQTGSPSLWTTIAATRCASWTRAHAMGYVADAGQAAHEQLPCPEELTATEELSLVQASPLPAVAELTTARIESWRCGQGARRTGAPSNPDAGEPSRAGGGDDDQEAELPEATASHVGLCAHGMRNEITFWEKRNESAKHFFMESK